MPNSDNARPFAGQSRTDCLIIGGGVMGLWTALKASRAGLDVVIADASRIGSGASGGLLGALFPWWPERWNDKKQFQFDSLRQLPGEIALLEAETGLNARFARAGRLLPLDAPHLRTIHEALSRQALDLWTRQDRGLSWQVLDRSPYPAWIGDDAGPYGFAHDNLAARIDPRALTSALRAALESRPRVRLVEGTAIAAVDPASGTARLGIETIRFGHVVIAAGLSSFPMIAALLPPVPRPIGQGVKGQSAMMAAETDPGWPVIFRDGLYVVAHDGNRVAIGSTSENIYDDPDGTDWQLDALIEQARQIVPLLKQAPVIERWAGIRPKAIGRDPMVGRLPGLPNVIALTGGFKIGFGLAHRLADCVVAGMTKIPGPDLPTSFRPEAHLAAAGRP